MLRILGGCLSFLWSPLTTHRRWPCRHEFLVNIPRVFLKMTFGFGGPVYVRINATDVAYVPNKATLAKIVRTPFVQSAV